MNFLSLFSFLSLLVVTSSVNTDHLNTGVWLSGAAYCGKDKYPTMKLAGPASGFVYKDTLYDIKTDLQGYIGTIPTKKNIYVVIRGSSSTMNWLDDFEVKKVPYTTYPSCNCQVHNGFYRSALGVRNKTIDTVKLLKKQYPTYDIIITGHSYGASVSQLLAMELEHEGISVKLYNYGQPRVGDQKYSGFVNTVINEYYRTVHNKDIVPHVPPTEGMNYYHSCTELFEDSTGKVNVCSSTNCEDPKCSDQYPLAQTNSDDHEVYLQHRVSCDASTY